MESRTGEFRKAAAGALADEKIQKSLRMLYDGFYLGRIKAAAATPGWEKLRDRARSVKEHTLDHLDSYLDMLESAVVRAGGQVYFAADASSAAGYIRSLARDRGVKQVIKGKSMVSEEISLNEGFTQDGIESVETDLGEYIIQLAGQTPFHIVTPAIHLSKEDIAELLHQKLGVPLHDRASEIAGEARLRLRDKFIKADMGVTGANFMVAETGTLILVTNEGNGRMCTSMPKLHVAVAGMEKVIPSMEDLGTFLRLLVRSATGQRLSTYVTAITGPRLFDEEDGPEEFHLVILDNGRSRLLADPELKEALYCLRCGACLNACPVYRKVGGHAYGWVYPGPIGAIVSPMLTDLAKAKDLPYACSLCGACRDACPVHIDQPRMLLYLRHQLVEGSTYPGARSTSVGEKAAIKALSMVVSKPILFTSASRIGPVLQRPFLRKGRMKLLPPPLSGWTRYRTFPAMAMRSFHSRWHTMKGRTS